MIPKLRYSDNAISQLVNDILNQMSKDNWKPDYVVGITRGGLLPALYISHRLNIPMETLKVNLRDHRNGSPESNLWMAEDDAFGYVDREGPGLPYDVALRKNILIVDDINDTGATLDWIINDWKNSCIPDSEGWDTVWGQNVRFAVLVDNLASKFTRAVDYCGAEINKAEKDVWVEFPWER